MRFAYTETMCDHSHYLPLAQAAEDSGFDTMLVPDSVCYPEVSDSKYPYTADGNREFLKDKPFIEPIVQIAAMAAVTRRIRFLPFVLKVPIRQPVLLAKQISSLAVMSDNRFLFGAGLSPWPDDYLVTGERWEGRGKRFDEMLEIIYGLLDGQFFSFKGRYYDIPSIQLCPGASQRVPLIIGGHAEPALKRAARVGDGWVHAGAGGRDDTDELKRMIERIRELRAEYKRSGDFMVLAVSHHCYTDEGLKLLEEAGVTHAGVAFRDFYNEADAEALPTKIGKLQEYAKNFIG